MITISKLAKRFKLSRTTLLYYEKEGLLLPQTRSENGYRWYGPKQIEQLESILAYRAYGLAINEIKSLVLQSEPTDQFELLKRHFEHISEQIDMLKGQQRAIIKVLQEPDLLKAHAVDKEQWVEIMKMSGLDEAGMTQWHRNFEQTEPGKHTAFLQSLGLDEQEIDRIKNL